MTSFSLATLFLPEWALPWMVVLAITALVVGARGLAGMAAGVVAADLVLAPLLAPWIDALPDWALAPILVVFGLMVLNSALAFLFGREAAGHVTGTLLMRLFDLILLGPFRLLRALLRARR